MSRIAVVLFAALVALVMAVAAQNTTVPLPCFPIYKTTQAQCNNRISACEGEGVALKWSGAGCYIKVRRGRRMVRKPVGDGGCQCDGYCGYTCKNACKRDPQCSWTAGACVNTISGMGGPMPVCNGTTNATVG